MSSFDKTVKLACKPKAAAPKAKYLDPIIAATWSEEGAIQDLCKALAPRLREPNAIVVFKALIVLHTMIRSGSTDNVLSHLASSDVLRLRNVSGASWEGYSTPENLQNYARYLDSRIKAYGHLKHDAIRVQADTNRDMRNSAVIEDSSMRRRGASAPPGPARSKTITGRKLRSMTVEKGLLRETKAVHRMIDALIECRFYLDDLEDELTITALRMLVKDLLILFQAGNEGVINVLEHYFEMSHIDAKEALGIYRHFCKQTELVVEFLGVARKLQNLLNVPIPNLKHAPVSLAGALQEYLDDPNFEQNRLEYKANKEAADRPAKQTNGTTKSGTTSAKANETTTAQTEPSTSSAPTVSVSPPGVNKDIIDFFASIEEGQTPMFNPQTNSPSQSYFLQQAAVNPFAQAQMTGFPQASGLTMQQTGFIYPQATAVPSNPFGLQAPQVSGHRPFSSFLPDSTGSLPTLVPAQNQQMGFLQSQPTGYVNPFRQSMLVPQTTGMALFGVNGGQNGQANFANSVSTPNPLFNQTSGFIGDSSGPNLFASQSDVTNGIQVPARPSSTPLTSLQNSNSDVPKPVKTHQTGTNNPFGRVPSPPPPPVPRQPTLMELAMSGANHGNFDSLPTGQQQQPQNNLPAPLPPQSTGAFTGSFGFNSGALSAGSTDMSSVASSFTNLSRVNDTTPSGTNLTSFDNKFSTTSAPSAFSLNTTAPSNTSASVSTPLVPQTTGFTRKPFKPSSSFGASLLESLPPIPGSGPSTPALTGVPGTDASKPITHNGSTSIIGSTSTPSIAPTPSALTGGLRPQMTGGPANPFRPSTVVGFSGIANSAWSANPPNNNSFGSFNSTPQQSGQSASLI